MKKANERLTTFFSGLNYLIVLDDVGQQGGGEGSWNRWGIPHQEAFGFQESSLQMLQLEAIIRVFFMNWHLLVQWIYGKLVILLFWSSRVIQHKT